MDRRRKPKEVKAPTKRPLVREAPKDASTKVRDLEERLAGSCACGSSGAAVCGAGGVMAWERGRGEGARGRGGR